MSHLEAALEAIFRDAVRKAGGMTEKVAPTNAGMPDRMVLWPGGRIVLVELKREGEDPRPIQVEWHKKAAAKGTVVVVLRGRAEILAWVSAERLKHQTGQA